MTGLLRVAAVVVLVGGSAAVLSSCTGSTPEVDTSPTVVVTSSSPEASVTASPTPTALPPLTEEEVLALIPADAQVESFPGAVNFAKFFLEESQAMLVGGDARLFREMSSPGCTFCQASLDVLERVEARQARVEGGSLSFIDESEAGGLQADGTWNVSMDVNVEEQIFLDDTGAVLETVAPEKIRVGVALVFEAEGWEVRDVASEIRP